VLEVLNTALCILVALVFSHIINRYLYGFVVSCRIQSSLLWFYSIVIIWTE